MKILAGLMHLCKQISFPSRDINFLLVKVVFDLTWRHSAYISSTLLFSIDRELLSKSMVMRRHVGILVGGTSCLDSWEGLVP